MYKFILVVAVVAIAFSTPAFSMGNGGQDHTCQGGHNCTDGDGGGSSSNSDSSSESSSRSVSSSSGGSGSGTGSVTVEGDDVRSYSAPAFSASQGTDTVQLGSSLFGSVTVSTDERSQRLRHNVLAISDMHKAGLISDAQVREFAQYAYQELLSESKPSKCLGVIPCGKDRKITNLFKLI